MKIFRFTLQVVAFCTLLLSVACVFADALNEKEIEKKTRQLDEQTQNLKRDILELGRNIAYLAWVGGVKPASGAESKQIRALSNDTVHMGQTLAALEDGALSPPGIQLVVFVSAEGDSGPGLKTIDLKIDGVATAQRSYSAEETQALQHNGTHRLYIGNLPEGNHRLDVNVTTQSGSKGKSIDTFSLPFIKKPMRKTIELHLSSFFGSVSIHGKEWE